MPKVRPMVTCIFCGLHRLASIEDIISKWIRYALDLKSSVTIRAEPTGATARTQHLVVTLRDMVCEACNTGWMHDLEEMVKPFAKPVLTNKHGIDLNVMQQRDLARWAIMKVLLLEHYMRKQDPQLRTMPGYAPSGPELAWLMKEVNPPPRSRVWLGAFDAENRFVVTTQARLLTSAPVAGGSDPVPAHMTTLTIGCILLQVFSTDFVLADARSLPQYDVDPPWPYSQALPRVWPIKHQIVDWPPIHHVTSAVLDKVASWGQATATAPR